MPEAMKSSSKTPDVLAPAFPIPAPPPATPTDGDFQHTPPDNPGLELLHQKFMNRKPANKSGPQTQPSPKSPYSPYHSEVRNHGDFKTEDVSLPPKTDKEGYPNKKPKSRMDISELLWSENEIPKRHVIPVTSSHAPSTVEVADGSPGDQLTTTFSSEMPPGDRTAKKHWAKWSAEEDECIIRLRGSGTKWKDVSARLPGRSHISCRLRYQNYLEKGCNWDENQKTKLARLYYRFRKEMWTKVAQELEVPWRVAERMHWELGEDDMSQRVGAMPFNAESRGCRRAMRCCCDSASEDLGFVSFLQPDENHAATPVSNREPSAKPVELADASLGDQPSVTSVPEMMTLGNRTRKDWSTDEDEAQLLRSGREWVDMSILGRSRLRCDVPGCPWTGRLLCEKR
ncbi:hypothetical protein RJ035_005779 [Blastomyces gilchristii]